MLPSGIPTANTITSCLVRSLLCSYGLIVLSSFIGAKQCFAECGKCVDNYLGVILANVTSCVYHYIVKGINQRHKNFSK